MRKLFLAVSICLFIGVNAQTSPKEAKIKEMLELNGELKGAEQMINSLTQQMKTLYPNISEDYWSRFKDKLNVNEILELVIPIYDKYYTEGDLDEFIKFYKTPAGQKMAEKRPLIELESVEVGKQWGMKIAREIIEDIKKEESKNQN